MNWYADINFFSIYRLHDGLLLCLYIIVLHNPRFPALLTCSHTHLEPTVQNSPLTSPETFKDASTSTCCVRVAETTNILSHKQFKLVILVIIYAPHTCTSMFRYFNQNTIKGRNRFLLIKPRQLLIDLMGENSIDNFLALSIFLDCDAIFRLC